MAGGWSTDGAVQEQIDDSIEDAIARVHGCILMHRIDGNIAPLRRQHQHLLDLLASANPLGTSHLAVSAD